jgi:hypothetical protein
MRPQAPDANENDDTDAKVSSLMVEVENLRHAAVGLEG